MTERTQHEPRVWTETGAQLFDRARATREGHNYATGHDAVETAIDALTWREVQQVGSLPFSPGAAITALIQDLSLPRVSHIAHDGAVQVHDDVEHSHGLYGPVRNRSPLRQRPRAPVRGRPRHRRPARRR